MSKRGWSGELQSFNRRAESAWPLALGIHALVLGKVLVPVAIHMVGRGGQVETVEWAIYMALFFLYAPAMIFIAWMLPRATSAQFTSLARRVIVWLLGLEFSWYALHANWLFLLSALMASIITIVALGYAGPAAREQSPRFSKIFPVVVTAAFAWMCAASLISWSSSLEWLASAPARFIGILAALIFVSFSLRRSHAESDESFRLGALDYASLFVLVAFAFRTFPVVEFYHWGFYIGPIDELRQGGHLLWDTPSQYGFLSILIPTALPGNSWISFWFYQSIVFAVVAVYLYLALRRLNTRWSGAVVGFALTFAALYFRPRDASLILSAQMTPSGGPVRFIWSFVMLAFVATYVSGPDVSRTPRRFTVGMTMIWLASLLWSAEGAVYCSVIWFLAMLVFLAQEGAAWRESGESTGVIVKRVVQAISLPIIAVVAAIVLIVAVYAAVLHVSLDWRGYIEYVILYSRGGFGALPVDPTGSVWFIALLFFLISTVAAHQLSRNRRDPRLIAYAALWGGVWSVGSYFVGRSHPVNVLSLAPILLFAAAITLRLLRAHEPHEWHRLITVSLVPAIVMPIVMTFGHSEFPAAVTALQLPVSRFKEQLPIMPGSLLSVLKQAGARPGDAFVFIGDGRLMLPAWPIAGDGGRVTSSRSWLPKPYEIIGSLPADRRLTYISRNAERFPERGWLVNSKRDSIAKYSEHLAEIEREGPAVHTFENRDWTVSAMARATHR
ncbi:MAG TPA: hypothetical protein VM099_08135 [Gemmatimonadaceae bacterium]|nr:hypothetical protein [Gemmatimonadaceae bacterium]